MFWTFVVRLALNFPVFRQVLQIEINGLAFAVNGSASRAFPPSFKSSHSFTEFDTIRLQQPRLKSRRD